MNTVAEESNVAESNVADNRVASFGSYFLFSRTEVPLYWISILFQDLSGQEIRYCLHNPLKMTMSSALAIPESAAGAKTSDSVEIAAAVSSKSIFVSSCREQSSKKSSMKLPFSK